jgi:hypothetical protein
MVRGSFGEYDGSLVMTFDTYLKYLMRTLGDPDISWEKAQERWPELFLADE